MNDFSIAMRTGLLTSNVRNLLEGRADFGTASRLGVLTNSLQEFLNGRANISMASKLGLLTSDLQQLLDNIGPRGAIGLVIGLLMKRS